MRRGRNRQGDFIGRCAEWVATRMGSAAFLLGMTVFIITWFVTNTLWGFDPQYLVLNLMFSTMSSYAAPLIMLAQNRGAARDQVVLDTDRANNRRDRSEMAYLTGQITQLRKSLDDLPTRSFIRDEITAAGSDFRQLLRQRPGR